MSWQQWVLATWIALGLVFTPYMVGRERKPITPAGATGMVLVCCIQLALVVTS